LRIGEATTMTKLVLWSYQSGGGELFALSTGRVPPAEEPANWKQLCDGVGRSETAISVITTERPSFVLNHIARQDYYTLDWKQMREDWKRPPDA
jgi:hypothetical protein